MNTRRLNKLANHLLTGKLSVDKFDYSVFYETDKKGKTFGCALSQLPVCFPTLVKLNIDDPKSVSFLKIKLYGVWHTTDGINFWSCVADFFDISNSEALKLFATIGTSKLPTKQKVALNILEAVAKYKKQLKNPPVFKQ